MINHHEVKNPLKQYRNGHQTAPDDNPLHRQIEYINPEHLRPSPFNPPSRTEEAALRALKDSIARIGIEQPLKVAHDGTVIDGHRRLACALLLELAEVPIIREPPDTDTHQLFDDLNSTARRLSGFEELELYLRGGPVSGKTMKAIRWIAEACDPSIFRAMEERRLSAVHIRTRAGNIASYCGRPDDVTFRGQVVGWLVKHGQTAVRHAMRDMVAPMVIIAAVEQDRVLVLRKSYEASV